MTTRMRQMEWGKRGWWIWGSGRHRVTVLVFGWCSGLPLLKRARDNLFLLGVLSRGQELSSSVLALLNLRWLGDMEIGLLRLQVINEPGAQGTRKGTEQSHYGWFERLAASDRKLTASVSTALLLQVISWAHSWQRYWASEKTDCWKPKIQATPTCVSRISLMTIPWCLLYANYEFCHSISVSWPDTVLSS